MCVSSIGKMKSILTPPQKIDDGKSNKLVRIPNEQFSVGYYNKSQLESDTNQQMRKNRKPFQEEKTLNLEPFKVIPAFTFDNKLAGSLNRTKLDFGSNPQTDKTGKRFQNENIHPQPFKEMPILTTPQIKAVSKFAMSGLSKFFLITFILCILKIFYF